MFAFHEFEFAFLPLLIAVCTQAPQSYDPLDPLGAQQEYPFQAIGDDPVRRASVPLAVTLI